MIKGQLDIYSPLFHTERTLQTHHPQLEKPHPGYRLTALRLIVQPPHHDSIHNTAEPTSSLHHTVIRSYNGE